jgi:structure-specific endonuclease subunit SLX1
MEINLRDDIDVALDPNAVEHYDKNVRKPNVASEPGVQPKPSLNGVENLDFGYSSMKVHVEKSKQVLAKANNECAVCSRPMIHGENMLVVCGHNNCEAVSHLHCLSKHFLITGANGNDSMIPAEGSCPSCKKQAKWHMLIKELTLRIRGEKELAKLFKERRPKKAGGEAEVEAADEEFMTIEELEEDESDDFKVIQEFEAKVVEKVLKDNLFDNVTRKPSTAKDASKSKARVRNVTSPTRKRGRPRKQSQADETGWDNAEILE